MAATRIPAIAGPAARARFTARLPSARAAGNCSRLTISGVMACQAGIFSAVPTPMAKVSASSSAGVMAPSKVSAPSEATASSIQVWVNRSSRRRSTTSASAPEGSESRIIGMASLVCSSATRRGECERDIISHDSPTSSIHDPTFEIRAAIHSARKSGS